MSREPNGYAPEDDNGYTALVLTCPRQGCAATNVTRINDQCRCNFCGHESNIERFIPETLDIESYKGY